ncbi:MbtH family NRPS accessory protein [Kitasatospora sp. NPDC089797]|uniref:MbtH family protein n=1 Tax=Kitasatospora sp. NPDC089797 TaxID=3155298 RepID=UPI003422A122
MSEPDDDRRYQVVLNQEEQYSVWPTGRELPLGWRAEGFEGTREECLKHIAEVWTDMRPASLRRAMDGPQG